MIAFRLMNLPQEEKRKENKVEAITQRKRKFFVRYNLVTKVKLNVFMHLKFLTIPQNHYEQYLINTLIRQLI